MTLIFIDDMESLQNDPLSVEITESFSGLSQQYFLNGEDALVFFVEQLNLGEPCIIMLDMSFPSDQMSGHEILKKIRKISKNTPVIIFTGADNSSAEIADLINLGAFYFIDKQASTGKIIEIIKKAIFYYQTNITAALNEWLSSNPPERRNNQYITTVDGRQWTMEQIRTEIQKETEQGKQLELNIMKLTVDLIARNKEKIND
ncbi:response regulator [Treponema sp.]|uniref:response regulator n=1 Tax=Treponema sp. TaxID=166 RepID=UPI003FA1E40D